MKTELARRDVMRGGAAACAILPMASWPAIAEGGYTPLAYPEHARDLWWRYIEASLAWVKTIQAHEQAESDAKYDVAELDWPWLPRGPYNKFEHRDEGATFTMTRITVSGVTTKDGNWVVLEYQPMVITEFSKEYREQCNKRWQPYTAANSTEALELSKTRGEKEWRSFCGKVGQIRRRRKVKALGLESERAWERVLGVSQEIADAPCDGAAMLATKLALGMVHDMPGGSDAQEAEGNAMLSVYKTAARIGGFDPIEQYKTTEGI